MAENDQLRSEIHDQTLNCVVCDRDGCYGCSVYNFLSNLDESTGEE